MTSQAKPGQVGWRRPARNALAALALVLAAACGGHAPQIPSPRPMVNFMGARIHPDKAHLDSVNDWVTREQQDIKNDPAFMIVDNRTPDQVYPWEHTRMSNDTAVILYSTGAPETELPFEIYGHLHLMAKMGRQAEWLPEAPAATGFELEKAILARVADAWLLARTVYDAAPYAPLDEIVYAKEDGYLPPLIFTARPDDFAEARAQWARNNPDGAAKYRAWFLKTFNREPPGLRTGG
jgi:hypothetical protein